MCGAKFELLLGPSSLLLSETEPEPEYQEHNPMSCLLEGHSCFGLANRLSCLLVFYGCRRLRLGQTIFSTLRPHTETRVIH